MIPCSPHGLDHTYPGMKFLILLIFLYLKDFISNSTLISNCLGKVWALQGQGICLTLLYPKCYSACRINVHWSTVLWLKVNANLWFFNCVGVKRDSKFLNKSTKQIIWETMYTLVISRWISSWILFSCLVVFKLPTGKTHLDICQKYTYPTESEYAEV